MSAAFYIGATGMAAQQTFLDAIANNLVNAATPSYKADRLSFQSVLRVATQQGSDPALVSDLQGSAGMGVAVLQLGKNFATGELKRTDAPLDLALNADGFVEVLLPDGGAAWTRSLALQVNRDGLLATADGLPLQQAIHIPLDATAIQVDRAGRVLVTVPDEKAPLEVAQLELARFLNPAGLQALGGNLYVANDKSGDPLRGKPGDSGFGSIVQGYLEASNVKLVDQMTALSMSRQAFTLSAQVVQAADQMQAIVNDLRR